MEKKTNLCSCYRPLPTGDFFLGRKMQTESPMSKQECSEEYVCHLIKLANMVASDRQAMEEGHPSSAGDKKLLILSSSHIFSSFCN